MAAAMNTPVAVMETAGEGGPWGIALLASYMVRKKEGELLGDYLSNQVFAGSQAVRMEPVQDDVRGFEQFIRKFKEGILAEQKAGECVLP